MMCTIDEESQCKSRCRSAHRVLATSRQRDFSNATAHTVLTDRAKEQPGVAHWGSARQCPRSCRPAPR
jgi:hypothetical protein